MNMQMTPNTEYNASIEEVRNSMLRWFAEAMPEYTPEQFRSFKAHLYPDPQRSVRDTHEPDYETMYEDKHGGFYWRKN